MNQAPHRRVRVSASTSNLGPGFDLAGLALDRFLDVELRPRTSPEEAALTLGAGCESWPDPANNRLWQAFERAARARELNPRAYVLRARTEIPVGRGLGSSGAASVAGVLLADSLCPAPSPREDLLLECIELEGHPDNATPALVGGFTLSFLDRGRAVVIESEIHDSLSFAVAWPEEPLETARARQALPASVDFADAVENPRRLAALLAGLRRGDAALIGAGSVDRLHERHRLPLIRGGREALASARAAGALAALISGSGSGMFAICAKDQGARIAAALVRGFESAGVRAEGGPARVVREAPRVLCDE
jgi:homoserine kinase